MLGIDYGCWARKMFWSLQSATKDYDKNILEIQKFLKLKEVHNKSQ